MTVSRTREESGRHVTPGWVAAGPGSSNAGSGSGVARLGARRGERGVDGGRSLARRAPQSLQNLLSLWFAVPQTGQIRWAGGTNACRRDAFSIRACTRSSARRATRLSASIISACLRQCARSASVSTTPPIHIQAALCRGFFCRICQKNCRASAMWSALAAAMPSRSSVDSCCQAFGRPASKIASLLACVGTYGLFVARLSCLTGDARSRPWTRGRAS